MNKENLTEKCLMCKRSVPNTGWVYMWKGKQGFTCVDCGENFHGIGYYLLEKAQALAERAGIKVVQTKEKFGRMVMHTGSKDLSQKWIIEAIRSDFRDKYPEFDWDFS